MTRASTPLDILADLVARGLVHQHTPALAEHLAQPRTLYCGFDPTADSLHIGSLVPLLTLRRFQQYGHRPIVLVGGATGMIGDPSFKATERKLNDTATITAWVEKLKTQTSRFVDFGGANPARMANNYDWTHGVGVLEFLRDTGKHFSVNAMIARDAVKSRLEREDSGITFTEFSYALLQAFDFEQMFADKNLACTLQIGGSDQWGNMTAGTELIRKKHRGEAHVLTLPLVTKADGTKFGKTESGTIWLDAGKTSPYAFYQFWLNTADADVEKFFGYFSFKPLTAIKELMTEHTAAPEKRLAQRALAEELTALVHGEEAMRAAVRISEILFGGNVNDLTEADFEQLAQDGLPSFELPAKHILENRAIPEDVMRELMHSNRVSLVEGMMYAGLATSKREARDFIQQGAILHNGVVVTDETLVLTPENAKFGRFHLLRRGKKNYALLVHG